MTDQAPAQCDFNAKDLILRLDETLVCDIEAMDKLVVDIMEAVTAMGCAEDREFEVRLALEEALMNAIEHGCGGDPDKEVQVAVCCDESKGMLIVIRDPGPGFDPESLPNPVVGENLYRSHGRGVYMINQLVDEVKFLRGGTEIHMRID